MAIVFRSGRSLEVASERLMPLEAVAVASSKTVPKKSAWELVFGRSIHAALNLRGLVDTV